MSSEQDRDEQDREEVREKLRQSMDKLIGNAAKPVEELPQDQNPDDIPPVPVTKSG